MANFGIRIYVLNNSDIDQIEMDTNTIFSDWSDEEFISYAENSGDVYTLYSLFSGTRMFDSDVEIARAYLIDMDNENAKPIRCDYYKTILSVNKVISHRADYNKTTKNLVDTPIVHFEENEEDEEDDRTSKTYTIVVTNYDKETSIDDIVEIITDLDDIISVDVVNEDSPYIRLKVETEPYFDYDVLESTIDSYGGLDCEFIDIVDNC